MKVGDKALKALESVHGTKYEGGATPELLYPAAGKAYSMKLQFDKHIE